MTVREKVVHALANEKAPGHFTLTGHTNPRYEGVRERMDRQYVRMVEEVDWARIYIEARSRHSRHEEEPDYVTPDDLFDHDTCGRCLRDALLVTRA